MTTRTIALILTLTSAGLLAQAPGLDPASLLKPLGRNWPTYSGDYTGRRYSALAQVNQTTVKNLSLAWLSRGFVEGFGTDRPRCGKRPGWSSARRTRRQWNADHRWRRRDRRIQRRRPSANFRNHPDGRWRALPDVARQLVGGRRTRWDDPLAGYRKTRGGAHRPSRCRHVAQLSVHGDARRLSPEDRRAHGQGDLGIELSPFDQQYFSSMAPIIVGDHVIVRTGTIWTRRVISRPTIRKRASDSGSSTPFP